jgi:PAS domain S-box-containing protein
MSASNLRTSARRRKKNRHEWRLNLLQQLADILEQAVVGLDIDGTVEFWSAKAEQLFGWKASEIIGKKVQTLHAEAGAVDEFDDILERCMALGPQVLERTRTKKGGERVRIRLGVYPVRDNQRRPLGLFALVTRAPVTRPLTQRQREILGHIIAGSTDPQIAEILGIRARTVDAHVAAILAKLGASNRTEASALAVQFRLLDENVDVGDLDKPMTDLRGPQTL